MRVGTVYGDVFAERVLGNLINFKTFCESCAPTCSDCRVGYGQHVGDLIGMYRVSPPSGQMFDDPKELVKDISFHECDLLLIVGVHHDLLSSVDMLVEETGARAVIAPIEDPQWIPPGLREQVRESLNEIGIESAFPKPFCNFVPGEGKLIDEFIETYRIGMPLYESEVKNDEVSEIAVMRSAPCGNSWYVAMKVRGQNIHDQENLFDVIAKAHHAYPCTASMAKDREIGDALLHIAGYNHRYAVCDAVEIDCHKDH
ncbi:MAG: DUF166 domain-containing protein [Candidatus Thorarchaeota archaeon]